jgi:Tfp pilus assembly protein PilF
MTPSPDPSSILRPACGGTTEDGRQGRGKWAALIIYGCMVTVIFGTTQADNWFRFNNMGYQSMPGFGEFTKVNDYLRQAYKSQSDNPLNAPRVGYEKSDLYGRYGGDRVFESLHFFSGRQTLEGIHYASSFASKPMAFLQTAYSRDIKTPVPYILSRMNPAALPRYFDLYNISQLILVSDEAKKAIQTSSLFEKEADFGPLSVYRYRNCSGLYVDVPTVRPVLYTGKNWVGDFFQWYKAADQLDVLMVPESYIKSRLDRNVLSVAISNLNDLHALKKVPLDREGLRVNAHLEPLAIRFTTNKIGVPHLIKVSYFPNWKVRGAEGVYPVSPHLMLVIPREKEVELTYGRGFWDYMGVGITLGTLLFLLLTRLPLVKRLRFLNHHANPPFVPPLQKGGDGRVALPKGGKGATALPEGEKPGTFLLGKDESIGPPLFERGVRGDFLEESFLRTRHFLIIIVLLTAAGLIIAGAILRNKPVRTYVSGYKHYQLGNQLLEAKKVQEANRCFEKAIEELAPIVEARHAYDHQDVIHCMLFTAMSYERLGETTKAEDLYGTILKEYPYSRYVGECYVKIARIKKAGRDLALEDALGSLRRGDQAQALPLLKKALDQTELNLAFLRSAMTEDPYSVWARYANQDMEKERAYLQPKLPLLRALCDNSEVLQTLGGMMDEHSL